MVTSSRILKKTNTSGSKAVKVITPLEAVKIETNVSKYVLGIGRRKSSTATVRLYEGQGISTINNMQILETPGGFTKANIFEILEPLELLNLTDKFHFTAKTTGGGVISRIGAVRLALSRALLKFDDTLKLELKKFELLTRDSRVVERKKTGLRKARKATQYSKR